VLFLITASILAALCGFYILFSIALFTEMFFISVFLLLIVSLKNYFQKKSFAL